MARDNDVTTDRPQGILTSTEREILLGDESFEARGREARTRIRRRLGDALVDYIVLEEHLPQKDIETIFAPEGDTPEEVQDLVEKNLVEGLKAQVRFVYRAAEAGNLRADELIEDAVDEAQGTRIEKLVQKLEADPESLTLGELSDLRQAGEIERDEYRDVFRNAIGTPEPGMVGLDDIADLLGDEESESGGDDRGDGA